ncbi:hypothetical protein V8G54_019439 [Vigna mungo]|uniref:Uncharacterized protein n=1 Tax=Vigna mungo TaxID=3915 RepID=A0AAQ3RUZ1_VIGMU
MIDSNSSELTIFVFSPTNTNADIAVNFTGEAFHQTFFVRHSPILYLIPKTADGMFKGIYHGKQCHVSDIATVLNRAWAAGVTRIIVMFSSPTFHVCNVKFYYEC